VERLDANRIAERVRITSGIALEVEGPCAGGEVGASYVRWPDGHRAVLTWRPDITLDQARKGPLAVAEVLRAAGYPAPALELAAQVGTAVATVWELLPGSPVVQMTGELLDQVLALNEMQSGRLENCRTVPPVRLHLTSDGAGFCMHEPLRRYSDRTRRLEDWIATVGAGCPDELPGDDAVHLDFTPGNLLAEGNRVTGVVDWDGAGRGDRRFDLVTFRFGLHALPPDPAITDRLDRILDGFPAGVLDPMWAHMSLRMVDWVIRHYTPDYVDHWLTLAEQRCAA
jgi:hypothetical protein